MDQTCCALTIWSIPSWDMILLPPPPPFLINGSNSSVPTLTICLILLNPIRNPLKKDSVDFAQIYLQVFPFDYFISQKATCGPYWLPYSINRNHVRGDVPHSASTQVFQI